jgi:hypothetical protein
MMATVDPKTIRLFYHPKDRLRMAIGDERCCLTVKPVWASPITLPNRYLALLDGKGEEIVMIADPKALDPESRQAVERELRLRNLTAIVLRVVHAKQEFGATYWSVETDRGERDFVTQNLQENAQWFSDSHLLLIDVDGNRFEIPDIRSLDLRSQQYIHSIL